MEDRKIILISLEDDDAQIVSDLLEGKIENYEVITMTEYQRRQANKKVVAHIGHTSAIASSLFEYMHKPIELGVMIVGGIPDSGKTSSMTIGALESGMVAFQGLESTKEMQEKLLESIRAARFPMLRYTPSHRYIDHLSLPEMVRVSKEKDRNKRHERGIQNRHNKKGRK